MKRIALAIAFVALVVTVSRLGYSVLEGSPQEAAVASTTPTTDVREPPARTTLARRHVAGVSDPRRSQPVPDGPDPLGRDPESARQLLGLLGKKFESRAEKFAALREILARSGVCTATPCLRTKEELARRVQQETARGLVLRSSECYRVGCVAEVTSTGEPLEVLFASLQERGLLDWPAPTMLIPPVDADQRTRTTMLIFFNP